MGKTDGTDGKMADDLIDDLLGDLVPECRKSAEREGTDVTDPQPIHD